MSTKDRLDAILLNALTAPEGAWPSSTVRWEVDTSCPNVPIGFVRTVSFSLLDRQAPDVFWAYAISEDEFLNPLPATIGAIDTLQLESAFAIIRNESPRLL